MSQILITGVCSFTGFHLAQYLAASGIGPIIGSDLAAPRRTIPIGKFVACDVRQQADVARLFDAVQPDIVFHLSGSADENDPATLIKTNIEGTWNILHACHQLKVRPSAVLLIGSAAGYGSLPDGKDSFREDVSVQPRTFYGFSREAELTLGRVACEKWGLPVFLCRVFNLIGPGLSEHYAPGAILRRLIEAKRNGKTEFPLRNGNAIRDFVDVRDAVRAYDLIVRKGKPGKAYNIGSGQGTSIEQITKQLADIVGVNISISDDPAIGSSDRSKISRSIANIDQIASETGWRPKISLAQSLKDMVDACATPEVAVHSTSSVASH